MKKITFVTQNLNKVADAEKLMPHLQIEHVDFEVPEIQSLDLQEIATYKIMYAYQRTQKPCFVMDAALFLDCLNGFPGPFIKFYFKNTVGANKTCEIARLFDQRGCQWTTVLAYFDGQETIFFEETVHGSIAPEPRGKHGYDWDVIFVPKGESRTFAEMTFDEKQSFAVTKKLLGRFAQFLTTY